MKPLWGAQLWCPWVCLGVFFIICDSQETPTDFADHHPPEKLAWVLLVYGSVQLLGVLARRTLPTPAPNRAKTWWTGALVGPAEV